MALCEFSPDRLFEAYQAALSHPDPSGRLLGAYGDFAWSTMQDRPLAERVTREAIAASPSEPAYRISLARMLIDDGSLDMAAQQIQRLQGMNIGGSLQSTIDELARRLEGKRQSMSEESKGATRN
jgi:hypothetical protein